MKYPALGEALVSSVRRCAEGRDVAVAFSGGIDSGFVAAVAKKYARSVTLYTTGTDSAFDVGKAEELSCTIDLPWVHVKISKGTIESRIREMMSRTGITDPFTISYEMPLFCVCREAPELFVLTGQGSDEYFGGCAKLVGQTDEDYKALLDAGVDRLLNVSVPAERKIASSFGKEISYPFLDASVTGEISRIDPAEIRPKDMETRKSVLRLTVGELGYPYLSLRTKKASQYGSGTTDLIRALAKSRGKWFNQYIADLAEEELAFHGSYRGSVINARVDSVVKAKAEEILRKQGRTPSEAIEQLYRDIISNSEKD